MILLYAFYLFSGVWDVDTLPFHLLPKEDIRVQQPKDL